MKPDHRSAEAAAYRRWYKTAAWRRLAKHQLRTHPTCSMCASQGRLTVATVCDHATPHRGDEAAFWAGPFQSLCESCHAGPKQRQERRGYVAGCDADGRPLDPSHPWNRRKG